MLKCSWQGVLNGCYPFRLLRCSEGLLRCCYIAAEVFGMVVSLFL